MDKERKQFFEKMNVKIKRHNDRLAKYTRVKYVAKENNRKVEGVVLIPTPTKKQREYRAVYGTKGISTSFGVMEFEIPLTKGQAYKSVKLYSEGKRIFKIYK